MKFKTLTYAFIVLGFSLQTANAFVETQKYENYLNRLTTLEGNFTQVSSNGQQASGTIQISRPGRMRLNYNPPSPLLIVSDGKWLITYDKQAGESNYTSLDKTPAAFILRSHVRFRGDVEVTNVVPKGENTTEISLIRKDDPDAGYITLVFQDNPLAFKEWSVIDGQGVTTRVTLSNIRTNMPLPPELFAIESPNLFQQIF